MTGQPVPSPPLTRPSRIIAAAWASKWVVLGAILISGVAAWRGTQAFLGPEVAVERVVRVTLVETIVATGNVQTPFRVVIGSQIVGTVATVQVVEGQRVTKGQPLISLENGELAAALGQAQGGVAQAEARMHQLAELTLPIARDSLRQAEATLVHARQTFARAEELFRSRDETRVVLDTAQRDLNIARTQVQTAELQVYTASPGGADYVTAQTQLNQAIANRDSALSRLGYATIAAPRGGILIARNVEQGAIAKPGDTLMVLAPDGEMQIATSIDERNLAKLAIGRKAVVSADAYPARRFAAAVSYINPAVDIARASVEVKLTVADPPDYLRQDMTVSVDIEVARAENTIVVSASSVHDTLSADPWVLTVSAGRAKRHRVRIGLQGSTKVEILEGLAEGDLVLPAISPVKAGQRVRAIPS